MSAADTRPAREGRFRHTWFAETLVVLGILAFAYFAVTLQGNDAVVLPSIVNIFNG
jgi:hypothetical protein